jgi:hypothetical protein
MRGMRYLTGTIALLVGGFVSLHAQDPSARVARTSYLQGNVSFRPGTVDDWTSATLNYPLTTGDHLWTDDDARAELHVGANAIRLGPQTAFEIVDLDDQRVQLRLTQGTAIVRVRTLGDDDNLEIETPSGAVALMRTGSYRVDVSTDGATSTVTVRRGDAEVTSNDGTVRVRPYQTVLFANDGASPDVRAAAPLDEWDQWSDARDLREDQSVSARYVSRDMTGYEDLDANGSWSEDPDYGHVWVPARVASNWAPYRYGRWAWVEPWGWTWIDDAPWGFAPFHYGRWAYVRNRWVWAPGVMVARPVYAPALVAFVGGSHFNVSVRFGSGGGVAWFPLAPGEYYRPAYHASDRYARNVNVTNVHVTNVNVTNVNVTNVQYRNQRVNGAVTAVPRETFASARPIGRVAYVVPQHEAQSAKVEWKNSTPPRPATFESHAAVRETKVNRPVAPTPRVQPNRDIRPDVNVRAHAADDQPRGAPMARPEMKAQPEVNVRPQVMTRPEVYARPGAPVQPRASDRPAPRVEKSANQNQPPRASEPRRQPEVRADADARRAAPQAEKGQAEKGQAEKGHKAAERDDDARRTPRRQ